MKSAVIFLQEKCPPFVTVLSLQISSLNANLTLTAIINILTNLNLSLVLWGI